MEVTLRRRDDTARAALLHNQVRRIAVRLSFGDSFDFIEGCVVEYEYELDGGALVIRSEHK